MATRQREKRPWPERACELGLTLAGVQAKLCQIAFVLALVFSPLHLLGAIFKGDGSHAVVTLYCFAATFGAMVLSCLFVAVFRIEEHLRAIRELGEEADEEDEE